MIILYSTIYLISNGRRKYIIRGKFKNINYKKVAKYWFCFQMFSLLCNIFPTYYNYFMYSHSIVHISTEDIVYSEGYDAKTEERDRKLEKLLKKRWL